MTRSEIRCPRCGNPCEALIYQRLSSGKLAWSVALRCRACQYREESDGAGLPPPDLRYSILKEEGTYELVLERHSETAQALRQIQTALGLPISTMALLKKNMPGPVLSGTKFEMDWLANILRSKGTIASVRPMSVSQHGASLDLSEIVPAG